MRALVSILASIAILATAACHDAPQTPVSAKAGIADTADQVFFGAQFLLTTRGIQRGDLTADTAYILEDQTRFDLRRTNVVFTTETGAPQGTMTGDRGIYSTRTQVLDGRGNVVVKLVDGRTLKSPHVMYNQMTHLISSDTTYTISDTRGSQTGIGFTSDQTFKKFTCLKNCGGNFSVLIPEK
jgi:LPS export ABC transporter protein LptC